MSIFTIVLQNREPMYIIKSVWGFLHTSQIAICYYMYPSLWLLVAAWTISSQFIAIFNYISSGRQSYIFEKWLHDRFYKLREPLKMSTDIIFPSIAYWNSELTFNLIATYLLLIINVRYGSSWLAINSVLYSEFLCTSIVNTNMYHSQCSPQCTLYFPS